MNIMIRKIIDNEVKIAIDLAWEVFQQFEAPDYDMQGVIEFQKIISDSKWLNSLDFYGAFKQGKLVGLLATRNKSEHIALFFVKGDYLNRGIGRALFESLLKNSNLEVLTVNSSPFAVPFYHKLGFEDIDKELVKNGIRYTPMKWELGK